VVKSKQDSEQLAFSVAPTFSTSMFSGPDRPSWRACLLYLLFVGLSVALFCDVNTKLEVHRWTLTTRLKTTITELQSDGGLTLSVGEPESGRLKNFL
jgi:hypothetical protein